MNNSSIQYTFVMKIVAWSCSATFESNVYMFFHPVFTIHSHLFINLRIGIGKKVYFIARIAWNSIFVSSLKSNKTIATQIIIMWAMSILEHIFVIVIIFKKKKKIQMKLTKKTQTIWNEYSNIFFPLSSINICARVVLCIHTSISIGCHWTELN